MKDGHRIHVGTSLSRRELVTIHARNIEVPSRDRLIHLQFRRFAGCPVCDLHLQSVVRRHEEIVAAGIQEIAVFHSSTETLKPHADALPFDVIADPGKRLYAEFGVEAAPRALLDPRAWLPVLRGLVHSTLRILRGRQPVPEVRPHGGSLGLPADFLIASDGRVLACKYGAHAFDQWSVDELLALAVGVQRARARWPGLADAR
ncbi:MAG: AhpC/TSA family protein [Acidobacteria bacterium]|nr:AhpC/TSA family protein [Acidobacteriota bacterium]